MTCELCKTGYSKLDGVHYDEGGFLTCEDRDMFNRSEAQRQNAELTTDAQRSEILDILKSNGPCHPGTVSRVTGMHVTECRWHLEEMKNNGEIDYSFVKGYSV